MIKLILILLVALCLSGCVALAGCVSIKARAITEKDSVPKYQLEAEYTIFQLGK